MLQIWTKPTRWLLVPSWAIRILLNKSRLILGPNRPKTCFLYWLPLSLSSILVQMWLTIQIALKSFRNQLKRASDQVPSAQRRCRVLATNTSLAIKGFQFCYKIYGEGADEAKYQTSLNESIVRTNWKNTAAHHMIVRGKVCLCESD